MIGEQGQKVHISRFFFIAGKYELSQQFIRLIDVFYHGWSEIYVY